MSEPNPNWKPVVAKRSLSVEVEILHADFVRASVIVDGEVVFAGESDNHRVLVLQCVELFSDILKQTKGKPKAHC